MITIIRGCVACYVFFQNLKISIFGKFFEIFRPCPWKKKSTVLDGFFPYLAQMITNMRECVAYNDLWPWLIFFKVIRPWPWKPCPLYNIYSSGWILSIFGTNDHQHEKVCHMWWPLTLAYIFKVIRPWPWKPCPLYSIYSSGWILSIFGTNDHYHERVCRTQWPLTLTYIFKVIWPWLRKSCQFCSIYSSGWILFIFSTNDHYH